VLKTVIFSFQVGVTGDFVSDCPFKLKTIVKSSKTKLKTVVKSSKAFQ